MHCVKQIRRLFINFENNITHSIRSESKVEPKESAIGKTVKTGCDEINIVSLSLAKHGLFEVKGYISS